VKLICSVDYRVSVISRHLKLGGYKKMFVGGVNKREAQTYIKNIKTTKNWEKGGVVSQLGGRSLPPPLGEGVKISLCSV